MPGARAHAIGIAILLSAACAGTLAGCSERAPRPSPERDQAYNVQGAERFLHERTLMQGESARISY